MTGELRSYVRQEIDRSVRGRPDFIPPEKLAHLEARIEAERTEPVGYRACACGCGARIPLVDGRVYASGACRVRAHRGRRASLPGTEALAA